jgi:phosphoribosyl-ATP pyrophosphohydrolase
MGKSAKTKKANGTTLAPIQSLIPKMKVKSKTKTKKERGALAGLSGREAESMSDTVLDRLYDVVLSRRTADPSVSHSARLLSRGTAKVAQKFGEEAVECLIEAISGDHDALVAESADLLYHLLVLWVAAGVRPEEVWAELARRQGVSGIAEKASRPRRMPLALQLNTSKIP